MMSHLIDLKVPLFFTIDDVMTGEECDEMIAIIERLGPEIASVSLAGGPAVRPEIRNNTRVIFDNQGFAETLFERVRARLPAKVSGMRAVGANERFRCYKYEVGQRFTPHYDGAFFRDALERSLLTFMVYLNEGFEGGATNMLDLHEAVTPKRGRALLFQHAILHEGATVTAGVKYVLRSDIMYRRAA